MNNHRLDLINKIDKIILYQSQDTLRSTIEINTEKKEELVEHFLPLFRSEIKAAICLFGLPTLLGAICLSGAIWFAMPLIVAEIGIASLFIGGIPLGSSLLVYLPQIAIIKYKVYDCSKNITETQKALDTLLQKKKPDFGPTKIWYINDYVIDTPIILTLDQKSLKLLRACIKNAKSVEYIRDDHLEMKVSCDLLSYHENIVSNLHNKTLSYKSVSHIVEECYKILNSMLEASNHPVTYSKVVNIIPLAILESIVSEMNSGGIYYNEGYQQGVCDKLLLVIKDSETLKKKLYEKLILLSQDELEKMHQMLCEVFTEEVTNANSQDLSDLEWLWVPDSTKYYKQIFDALPNIDAKNKYLNMASKKNFGKQISCNTEGQLLILGDEGKVKKLLLQNDESESSIDQKKNDDVQNFQLNQQILNPEYILDNMGNQELKILL